MGHVADALVESTTVPLPPNMWQKCKEAFVCSTQTLDEITDSGFVAEDPRKHIIVAPELPGQSNRVQGTCRSYIMSAERPAFVGAIPAANIPGDQVLRFTMKGDVLWAPPENERDGEGNANTPQASLCDHMYIYIYGGGGSIYRQ